MTISKLYFKYSIILLFLFFTSLSLAQVGINTENPKTTLDVEYNSTSTIPPGIRAPNLSLTELDTYTSLYGNLHKGAFVYLTEVDPALTVKTEFSNITSPGYYFFDGMIWNVFALPQSESIFLNTEPWFSTESNLGATLDTENIYHSAQVGIGKKGRIDPNAQLEITSSSKGLIIPRLSTVERNAITNPTTSMMIWNTDELCFNFYKGTSKGWKSICENTGEAEFTILDCQNATVNGQYIVGKAADTSNYIQLNVNVTEKGTYNIEGTTTLGLYFQRSGSFPDVGNYTIIIPAFGSPTTATANIVAPQTDLISLSLNNTPSLCQIKMVTIEPATVTYSLDNIPQNIVAEDLIKGASSFNKKITLKLNVQVAGTTNITATDQANFGIIYNAYNVNLPLGQQTVVLYANGASTPANYGPNTLSFKLEGLGFVATDAQKLFNVNLGTNEAEATCDEITVNGEYIAGKQLTAANTITVKANVTKIGTYNFSASNNNSNIKFTASGSFTTLGTQTFTAQASTITDGAIGPITGYSMTSTFNTQAFCNFNLDIIYPSVKVLVFGTNSNAMQLALKNLDNFGPKGKFKIESLENSVILDRSSNLTAVNLRTYINTQNYQIIVLPVRMGAIPTDAQQVLADFINLKKGVVIYSGTTDQKDNISGIINKLFPNNTIEYDQTLYNIKAAILPYVSNTNDKKYPYINGLFDTAPNGLAGKYYLGQDENSWFGIKPETLPSGLNSLLTLPAVTIAGINYPERATILFTDKPGLFVMPTNAGYVTPNNAYGFASPISASTQAWGNMYILGTNNSVSNGSLAAGSIVNWPLMGNILSESIKHLYTEYKPDVIIQ